MTAEVGTGVTHLQAKGCQGVLVTLEPKRKHGRDFPESLGRAQPVKLHFTLLVSRTV